jgi:hypothetical protein
LEKGTCASFSVVALSAAEAGTVFEKGDAASLDTGLIEVEFVDVFAFQRVFGLIFAKNELLGLALVILYDLLKEKEKISNTLVDFLSICDLIVILQEFD